jgi:hypothetical protein
LSLFLSSCSSTPSSNASQTSGLKFRVLVSQDVSTNLISAGMLLIDADLDRRSRNISAGSNVSPQQMYLSDNRQTTVVVSNSNNMIGIINNAAESSVGTLTLPGPTDSIVISPDGNTAYAAVPAASVVGFPQGGLLVFAPLSSTSSTVGVAITATVPIASVRYLTRSGDGTRILAFSDNSDTITIVPPLSIIAGQGQNTPLTMVSGFDRPIAGFVSQDGSMAWILNCGPECGGTEASVQVLDLINNLPGPKVAVPGGVTAGLLVNQTLYLTGNPMHPNNTCTGPGALNTAATTCGRLSTVDLPSMTVTGPPGGYVIQDGFHTLLALGANNQMFLGSKNCTNIVPPAPPATGEQRGCLYIADVNSLSTGTPRFVAPPDNGDVTGIQPITNRSIVYVIEGGQLRFYDTTTDSITSGASNNSIDIIGQAIDVKLIDF